MKNFCPRQNGFTLVEVLIASALLSVILAALYGTFFLSGRAVSGLDESMIKLQEARRTLDMLRRELESCVFRAGDEKTLFKLEDRDVYGRQTSRIMFTALSPLRPGLSGISYYVKESGDNLALHKETSSVFGPDRRMMEAEMIEDIGEFSLEVRYGEKWVKTWDSGLTKKIPDEIKISLRVRVKDRDFLLSGKARPRIT